MVSQKLGTRVFLTSGARNARGWLVIWLSGVMPLFLSIFVNGLYLQEEAVRAAMDASGSLPLSDTVARSLAFYFLPCYVLACIAGFLVPAGDFSYHDKPWKQRIIKLFKLELGLSNTLMVLAFGLICASTFDFFVSSQLPDSQLRSLIRLLSGFFILLNSMGLFAALALRSK